MDKSRGGTGERASDARNRTGLRRLRGNPAIKGLCLREGVIGGSPTAPNNSVFSRTAIQSASGTTITWSGHSMRCLILDCSSVLSSINSMRNHVKKFHHSCNIMVKNSCKSSLHYPSTVSLSSSIHRKRKDINDMLWKKNQLLKFGVWNVRTLKGVGRTDLLAKELITTDITLCGITETHLPSAGMMDLDEDSCYHLLFSGPPELASRGVGLVVRHNVIKSLNSFDPISDRILRADFLTDKGILNVIVGYAPTEQCEEVVKEEFYQQLDVAMHKTGSLVVVLGDFNARLGKAVSKVVGQFGLSKSTSDNGVRLIEFCQAHNLGITNTFFQHKNIHTATWYPPNPKLQPSLKDYVLVKQSIQKMVHYTRVRRGPNFDSDHKLVCSKMVLKLQKPRGKR